MIPKNRVPTHPGEILLEEFLIPMGLSQVKFAAHIGVPVQRVNEIVRGKRGITPRPPGCLPRHLAPLRSSGSTCRQTMTSHRASLIERCVNSGRLDRTCGLTPHSSGP